MVVSKRTIALFVADDGPKTSPDGDGDGAYRIPPDKVNPPPILISMTGLFGFPVESDPSKTPELSVAMLDNGRLPVTSAAKSIESNVISCPEIDR